MIASARLAVLLASLVVAACGGTPAGKGKPVPVTKKEGTPKRIAARDEAPPSDPAAEPAAAASGAAAPVEPAVDDKADPLGQRFMDPGWFRKDMLPDAKALDVSRSQKNEQGLFSSQILFEMPGGTTTEQCADQITDKVKGDVTNLERTVEADGRVKMTGTTERYRVTLMCGEAKGVMRAYVSYEWTS